MENIEKMSEEQFNNLMAVKKLVEEEASKNPFDFSDPNQNDWEKMLEFVRNRLSRYLAKEGRSVCVVPKCIMPDSKIYIFTIKIHDKPNDVNINPLTTI